MPATTTGEMKSALGKLRDYLAELLGEDSSDKKTARERLGIKLSDFASQTDIQTMQAALEKKADKSELQEKADREKLTELECEIARKGAPVGSIDYFAMAIPPAGYLKADGAAVGRETYPELFAAIGTTFGEGDGETTFNLPDLIDRFAQGSNTPGQKVEAGLPNIEGVVGFVSRSDISENTGAFNIIDQTTGFSGGNYKLGSVSFNASRSNLIYGASDTVQPPALTLLPCIKAFDAATNPGLIDVTELASDVSCLSANKLDKAITGTTVKYVTETYSDGTNWYRKWSDGWLEQGGFFGAVGDSRITVTIPAPYANAQYIIALSINSASEATNVRIALRTLTYFNLERAHSADISNGGSWYACGQGA